jgi:hypothetical protein
MEIQQVSQTITTANRYDVLSYLNEPEFKLATPQQTRVKARRKMDNPRNTRNKILFLGDSHVRGMAAKLQHNLDDEYSVQGQVKPSADLTAILASGVNDVKEFSKKDLVIVWGGTKDVSRNESDKGLIQIRNFVNNNAHTNIIVMNLPYRFDLEPTSCVNHETRVFNRKLGKQVKACNHVRALEMNFERDHYTRHGLHLNTKGKDYTTNALRFTIKNMFNINRNTPITMNWKLTHEESLSANLNKIQMPTALCPEKIILTTAGLSSHGADHSGPDCEVPDEGVEDKTDLDEPEVTNDSGGGGGNTVLPIKQPSPPLILDNTAENTSNTSITRNRKKPVTRTNDFLWGN